MQRNDASLRHPDYVPEDPSHPKELSDTSKAVLRDYIVALVSNPPREMAYSDICLAVEKRFHSPDRPRIYKRKEIVSMCRWIRDVYWAPQPTE